MYVYVYLYVCVVCGLCGCVRAFEGAVQKCSTVSFVYAYMCACVCDCGCVRAFGKCVGGVSGVWTILSVEASMRSGLGLRGL